MKENEKREPLRKARKRGETTQKLMTFRCDLDVAELLEQVSNKGRTINEALKEWFRSRIKDESHEEFDPSDGHDTTKR